MNLGAKEWLLILVAAFLCFESIPTEGFRYGSVEKLLPSSESLRSVFSRGRVNLRRPPLKASMKKRVFGTLPFYLGSLWHELQNADLAGGYLNDIPSGEAESTKNNQIDLTPEMSPAVDIKQPIARSPEIAWRGCDAQNLDLFVDTDSRIECRMWAPLGSNVSWYKDGKLKFFQSHPELQGQQYITLDDVDGNEKKLQEFSGKSKYEFELVAKFPLFYASLADEGTYLLKIETPNKNNYNRSFHLNIKGRYRRSFNNDNALDESSFPPTIVDYATNIIAKKGEPLSLPCRGDKKSTPLKTLWKKDNQILEETECSTGPHIGDLKINNLDFKHGGKYSCLLIECGYEDYQPTPEMKITTFVKVKY